MAAADQGESGLLAPKMIDIAGRLLDGPLWKVIGGGRPLF
jgi:hypothetical protein